MAMNIKNITKRPRNPHKPTIGIHIKITKHQSQWLKKNNYSPTGIWNEATKTLGYKPPK